MESLVRRQPAGSLHVPVEAGHGDALRQLPQTCPETDRRGGWPRRHHASDAPQVVLYDGAGFGCIAERCSRPNAAHRCPDVPLLRQGDPGKREARGRQARRSDEVEDRGAGQKACASRGENRAKTMRFPPKTAHLIGLGGDCYTRKLLKQNGGRDRTRTCDLLRVKNVVWCVCSGLLFSMSYRY